MPRYSKKYSAASSRYSKRRRLQKKWRQQKLAVGTVAKIAKKVASRLDRAGEKHHIFEIHFAADGTAWPADTLSLPLQANWRAVAGGALEGKPVSDIGGFVIDTSAANVTALQEQGVTIRMQGIQSRFCFQNRNVMSCRVRLYLIFIPNLNNQTGDAVDFLRPDIYMFGKTGTGNLVYDGWNKQMMNIKSASNSGYRRWTILDKRTFTLGPSRNTGQSSAIVGADLPGYVSKHVTLSKYFKGAGRKHYIKPTGATGRMLTDGAYYFVLHSDLPVGSSLHYVNSSQCKFKIGATQAAVNAPP